SSSKRRSQYLRSAASSSYLSQSNGSGAGLDSGGFHDGTTGSGGCWKPHAAALARSCIFRPLAAKVRLSASTSARTSPGLSEPSKRSSFPIILLSIDFIVPTPTIAACSGCGLPVFCSIATQLGEDAVKFFVGARVIVLDMT